MTPFQQKKYWWEWGRARHHFEGKGMSSAQIDQARHDLHRKALGRDKSSKAFTNSDLDAVIATFRAVWDDANLDAQLRQLSQAESRLTAVRKRIADLAIACGVTRGAAGLADYFRHWFKGRDYSELNERELHQLAGILERRRRQLKPAATAQTVQAGSVDPDQDDGQPF